MPVRQIAEIGEPILRQATSELTLEQLRSCEIQRLIDDLIATMREARGAGLAANQIFEPYRICVIEVSANARYPYFPEIPLTILVNPRVTALGDHPLISGFEGCLSVPNLRGRVRRHPEIHLQAWDRDGRPLDFIARGVTAVVFQHEVDHLDGTLFVDRIEESRSLCTWESFRRYHQAQVASEVDEIVKQWGS